MEPPFILYSFPRERIPMDGQLCDSGLSSGSLIHVSCNSGDFDPIIIYEVCICFIVL